MLSSPLHNACRVWASESADLGADVDAEAASDVEYRGCARTSEDDSVPCVGGRACVEDTAPCAEDDGDARACIEVAAPVPEDDEALADAVGGEDGPCPPVDLRAPPRPEFTLPPLPRPLDRDIDALSLPARPKP